MTDKQIAKNESTKEIKKGSPVYRYTPNVDIYETDDTLIVTADMPGVDEQGLQVEVERGILTLEGRTQGDERRSTEYYRQFKLSERIDTEAGEAKLKDGVLTLRLPKLEAAKPKKIAVKTVH
ncbi:MAG TPA: Hsp20/alpha crystallin family protein [Geopsychrobacteraceae bacterium]|nr:Hsp20/alpha crystallin family protein [Geopsychrobacteraceae bacterium]